MSGTSAVSNQHPRYGFTEQRMYATLPGSGLSNVNPTGASFERPPGVGTVAVVGVSTALAGGAQVNMILEGSNDNVNFLVLAQLAVADSFTVAVPPGPAETKVLNAAVDQQVDVQRFAYLRVRTFSPGGTYAINVVVTGIALDSEKFIYRWNFGRLGLTPTFQNGLVYIRPAGTKFTNVQVSATIVNLGGILGFNFILQGCPNYVAGSLANIWVDLSSVFVNGVGSYFLQQNGTTEMDLGSYTHFRVRVIDDPTNPPGPLTAYIASVYLTLDSMDWVDSQEAASGGGGGGGIADNALLNATFGAPGPEVGNTIPVDLYLLDVAGNPLPGSRRVECLLYDTPNAGDLDLATNAVFSAVGGGAVAISGIGTNRVVLTTDATGHAILSVLDAAVEWVYLTAVTPKGPLTDPTIVYKSQQSALQFVP